MSSSMHYACSSVKGCIEAHQSEGCAVLSRGRSRNFKRGGGGGPAEFSSKGGGGVQPLPREQFVLQINKILSKRGGGGGGGGVLTPLDLPWICPWCPSSGFAGPSLIRDFGPSRCSVQHLMNDQQGS